MARKNYPPEERTRFQRPRYQGGFEPNRRAREANQGGPPRDFTTPADWENAERGFEGEDLEHNQPPRNYSLTDDIANRSPFLADDYTPAPEYSMRGFDLRDSELGGTGEADNEFYAQHPEQLRPTMRGLGPKGYSRADESLREEICEKLTHDSMIDATDIDVEVSKGHVFFSGTVTDKRMKYRAEDITEKIYGVGEITNNIRVMRDSLRPGPKIKY